MGIRKIVLFDTQLAKKGSLDIYRNMALLLSSCWFYITSSLFFLIRFMGRYVFRIRIENSSKKDDFSVMAIKDAKSLEPVPEVTGFDETVFGEKETPSFCFKFEYQISEDSRSRIEEPTITMTEESTPPATTNISKYRFSSSEKLFSGFMEEPEAMTFSVQEFDSGGLCIDDKGEGDTELKPEFLLLKELRLRSLEPVIEGVCKISEFDDFGKSKKLEKPVDVILSKDQHAEKEKPIDSESNLLGEKDVLDRIRFLQKNDFCGFDLDSESTSSSDGYSVKNLIVDYDSDDLSERDFGGSEREFDRTDASVDCNRQNEELVEDNKKFKESHLQNLDTASAESRGGVSLIKNQIDYSKLCSDFPPERCFNKLESEAEEKIHGEETASKEEIQKSERTNLQHLCCFDSELSRLRDGKPISSLSHLDEASQEKDSSEPEFELNGLNRGETVLTELGKSNDTQSPRSRALQEKSLDSSNYGFSSLVNESSSLKSSDEVLSVKDLANLELKTQDLDGEKTGKVADIHSFEESHLLNLPNSDPDSPLNQITDTKPVIMLGKDSKQDHLCSEKKEPEEDVRKYEGTCLKDLDTEDSDELESLWEHQDLVEQLKMEIKKVRAFGLATILEHSESPKTIEDLKPWKIDEKFLHQNPMDELHKFYKSYTERMRKFDILNYQKMYAVGLQLKDPLQSMGSRKSLVPTITSLLSQNLWPFRHRKSETEPSKKFIKELQNDLEIVYVGQTCLSWEFLRWQYEKARELPESDPYRSHQYNQVAGEFQQFQVILQRFIENESFDGPRLPNYVKNRCDLRNLLQVPVIKEDCFKDKKKDQGEGSNAIRSEILEDIMEESIRIFWEFVKADKDDSTPGILKGLMGTEIELEDPSDFELMEDAQAILQKKEKKLKDFLRSGNCLVKRFKKPQEDRSNQDLFFSQVDVKLVSRVLKMSRITTDQLVWCHKKLSKITFADRKLHREPSFLLFPC